jgi:hypothetical protein
MKGDRVNPDDLRAICDSLNDERGTGGQTQLARLLGWHYSTVWRKLTGRSQITRANELAIRSALDPDSARLEVGIPCILEGNN